MVKLLHLVWMTKGTKKVLHCTFINPRILVRTTSAFRGLTLMSLTVADIIKLNPIQSDRCQNIKVTWFLFMFNSIRGIWEAFLCTRKAKPHEGYYTVKSHASCGADQSPWGLPFSGESILPKDACFLKSWNAQHVQVHMEGRGRGCALCW